MVALNENVQRLKSAKVRGRVGDAIDVLGWLFVVAPDDDTWPAFQTVESELRRLLGAYLREEALPDAGARMRELVAAASAVTESIDNISDEDLASADRELTQIYGAEWRSHARELLEPGSAPQEGANEPPDAGSARR